MTIQELAVNYWVKTLGKTDAEVRGLLFKKADDGTLTEELNDTALTDLEAAHATHISGAGADKLKAEYDRGHQAGKFEALNKAEDEIQKAYGLERKGKLSEMVAEIAKKAAADGATDDKVLTHPLYVGKVNELTAKAEAIEAEFKSKFDEMQKGAERQARFTQNLPAIDASLTAAGVELDKIPPQQKKAFLAQFKDLDFETTETGTYLKQGDGTLVKDKHHNPVKLGDFIAQNAGDWFTLTKQPDRKSAGNDPADPQKPTKWTKENAPKSLEEFYANYNKITDPAERSELLAAYEALNNPNAPKVAEAA